MSSLVGKVALVTGASRGIGRAVALKLAEAGADLLVTATTERGASDVCREIEGLGRKAVAAVYDAARETDADRLDNTALDAFGRVDVLVNNAGILHRAPLSETTDEDFERVIAINLAGPFRLMRRLLPAMVKRGFGRVVNVSSLSGTVGTPKLSAYCASKWGLNGLTKTLAAELSGTGVTVMAVLPGSVDTDMLRASGFTPKMSPEAVAGVVCYLCAEAPAAMNGSLVEVFG